MSTLRLARPGRRDDPRRSGQVADRGQLVGGQVGVRGDGRRHDGQAADVDRLAVDDRLGERQRRARAAVDPGRAAVGQRDVGRPVGRRDGVVVEAGGLDAPPPHGVADAGVVRVGPGQEVQAVERRLAAGGQPPRLDGDRRRLAERRRVDAEGDDDRLAPGPRRVQPVDRRSRVGQHGVVDRDDRRVRPRRRDRGAGDDDDAATERGRPGHCHPFTAVTRAKLRRGCHERLAP